MDGFWAWVTEHYILAFIAAWVFLDGALKITNRVLRTVKVCARGWPPEHLDADGDWKPEAEKE